MAAVGGKWGRLGAPARPPSPGHQVGPPSGGWVGQKVRKLRLDASPCSCIIPTGPPVIPQHACGWWCGGRVHGEVVGRGLGSWAPRLCGFRKGCLVGWVLVPLLAQPIEFPRPHVACIAPNDVVGCPCAVGRGRGVVCGPQEGVGRRCVEGEKHAQGTRARLGAPCAHLRVWTCSDHTKH